MQMFNFFIILNTLEKQQDLFGIIIQMTKALIMLEIMKEQKLFTQSKIQKASTIKQN